MPLRPLSVSTHLRPRRCSAACDGDGVRISSTTHRRRDAKGVLKVVDTLQCPQTIGVLTRKGSAPPAARSASMSARAAPRSRLHLVAAGRRRPPTTCSRRFETAPVRRHAHAPPSAAAADAPMRAEADRAPPPRPRPPQPPRPPPRRSRRRSGRRRRRPRLGPRPGRRHRRRGRRRHASACPACAIDADGDKASVRIGGFHIDADDSDGSASVDGSSADGESVSIQAHDDAAEIRTSAAGDATRATWILTDNRASDDGLAAGRLSRPAAPSAAPSSSPRSAPRTATATRVFDDAKDLVALNVGE